MVKLVIVNLKLIKLQSILIINQIKANMICKKKNIIIIFYIWFF